MTAQAGGVRDEQVHRRVCAPLRPVEPGAFAMPFTSRRDREQGHSLRVKAVVLYESSAIDGQPVL